MSMLARKGTIVRKQRGRSIKRPSGKSPCPSTPTPSAHPTPSPSSCPSNNWVEKLDTRVSIPTSPSFRDKPETSLCVNSSSRNYLSTLTIDEGRSLTRGVTPQYAHSDREEAQYGAIYLQIQEANKDADHSIDFLCRAVCILCNTLLATAFLGMLMILPIGMVSVGVKYLSDCPKQPKIPIYLLVGGCFGMLFLLVIIWKQIQYRRYDSMDVFYEGGDSDRTSRLTDIVLALFHIVWLGFGTFWVFGEWEPHYHQLLHEPNNWCDKTVYMFAVCQIIACYALLGVALLVLSCLCVCYKYTGCFETSGK